MNNNPIFLLVLHKSGTSLLRSLFDGHSNLFSIPIETHFFQNMNYWVDNEYRKNRPSKLNKDQIIESFNNWIKFYNNLINPLADSVVKGIFDENAFLKNISEIQDDLSDRQLISKYFESIFYSIYNEPLNENLRVVEKSVENAEFASELSKMFPSAKFIHIIRNPYANIVSLRKFKSQNNTYPLINRLLKTMYNSYYYLYKNKNIIDNYFILRYEDLVTNPSKYIMAMCHFLDINFEDILLTPSLLKKPWEGNSTFGQKYDSISSSNLNNWKKNINSLEIYYINKSFPFILDDFGYEHIQGKKSIWLPIKGETTGKYLANRFYKYYI